MLAVLTGESLSSFTEYCDKKYCSENLTFWQAVQEYRKIDEAVLRNLRARAIFEKYVVHGAPLQINLDGPIIVQITEALKNTETPPDLFDKAEKQVLYLMETDVLPGFHKSQSAPPNSSQRTPTSTEASEGFEVVGEWNHSKLPSNSGLAKKLGKELVKLDFEKTAVGLETLKAEEENKRLDAWCKILEREGDENKKQIHRLQKTAMQLLAEKEYLATREEILKATIERTMSTIRAINDSPTFDTSAIQ